MGTWTELLVNRRPIFGFKNYVDLDFVATLFRYSDYTRKERKVSEREDYSPLRFDSGEEIEIGRFFTTKSEFLRGRMEILGYKKEALEGEFLQYRDDKLKELDLVWENAEELKNAEELLGKERFEETKAIEEAERRFWKSVTLQEFSLAVKKVIFNHSDAENPSYKERAISDFDSAHAYLVSEGGYLVYSLPFNDVYDSIKFIVESIPEGLSIVLDLTDLSEGGYIEDEIYVEDFGKKIIILTEGPTDIEFLSGALQLLYPHLSEYYAFMDFKSAKVPGSASALVNTIKAFTGAGIENKIIALFDNDTAAREALTALESSKIPKNIIIVKYPSVDIGKHYPTLGPTGMNNMDINGLAGSIELYLGRDVLCDVLDDGLVPVQWKGYSPKMKAYQGEILYKRKVHEIFRQKLEDANNNRGLIEKQDWSSIDTILQVIFLAF